MNDVRSEYRVLNDEERKALAEFKKQGQDLINTLKNHGASREIALAITKVEEGVMWGTKALTT